MATQQSTGAVKVPHSTKFDPKQVKEALGLGFSSWELFMRDLKQLSQRTVSPDEAENYFRAVLEEPVSIASGSSSSKVIQRLGELYNGAAMGSELLAASGTAWGLVNAMTEYVDHHRRARTQDNRLDSAWFGQGAQLKQKALTHALTLLH
jgi:phage/plasmid-like protein (TIGR03299 family)